MIRVKVQKNRFPHLTRQFPRYAESLVAATAEIIERKAREKAPIGETRELTSSFGRRSARRKQTVPRWIVWNKAPYAGYVDYGTRHSRPRKFFRTTARAEIRDFRRRARDIESKLR